MDQFKKRQYPFATPIKLMSLYICESKKKYYYLKIKWEGGVDVCSTPYPPKFRGEGVILICWLDIYKHKYKITMTILLNLELLRVR